MREWQEGSEKGNVRFGMREWWIWNKGVVEMEEGTDHGGMKGGRGGKFGKLILLLLSSSYTYFTLIILSLTIILFSFATFIPCSWLCIPFSPPAS